MRAQKQLQNRYLIFQEAYDCSVQDLAFRRSQNGISFTELELLQMAYCLLKGIIYLQQKYKIELGFFSPNQVFYCSEIKEFKLNNFGQFYLDSFNKLPENLEELIFRPPEYYILGKDNVKHKQFSGGKGEIWSLGLLLRYCMADSENFEKEDDLMAKYFIQKPAKLNLNLEIQKKKNESQSQNNQDNINKENNKILNNNKELEESLDSKSLKNESTDSKRKRDLLNNSNNLEENIVLQTEEQYEQDEQLQQQFSYKIDRSKLIEDILKIAVDERYINQSTFLQTPYYLPYLNPFQEYLNGYKGVSNNFSQSFRDFVSQCLYVNPELRPSPLELINHDVFKQMEMINLNDTESTATQLNNFKSCNNTIEKSQDNFEVKEDKQRNDDSLDLSEDEIDLEENDEDQTKQNSNINDSFENIEEQNFKLLYKQIMQEKKVKKISFNRAYDEVIKKGNMNYIEDLFPLEIVIDIVYNEIEPNILSHSTIQKHSKKNIFNAFSFNFMKDTQSSVLKKSLHSIIQGCDTSYTLRFDCKPIYQYIVEEINYYQNVLKSVKELQTLSEYLGINQFNHNSNSFKVNQEKIKQAKNAINFNNTIQLDQSQFLNQTLMLNESTIFQTYDQNGSNNNFQNNNLDLSTILNDPDLSMCIAAPNQQMQLNKQAKQNSQTPVNSQQNKQQNVDSSFVVEDTTQIPITTASIGQKQQQQQTQSNSNSKQKETQAEQQKQLQQQQDLDKSSTSISFGFFKKMRISEKVSKFWGSNKNESQNQQNSQSQQNIQSSNINQQSNQINQKQGGTSQAGNTQSQIQGGSNINNDLFANSSQDNEGEFQPYPLNLIAPNNSLSPKIKEYLFYMNLLYEDRRVLSPKQIPQYLIQVELPSFLRPELYKKVIVLPQKAQKLYNYLVSVPLMYGEKSNDIKQIENDLPRCHQYSDFCSSQKGQSQIKEILYAFLNLNSNYYYIQGMDAMTFAALQIAPNNSPSQALLILQETVKKSLLMHQSSQQSPEDYIMKEKILIYKWLLRLEDPQLSDYLEEKQFYPEIYTISWFLNLFTMVFDINTVLKIWDFIICDCNFTLCFAVSLMIELKDHLMMKDSNELMSSIRNLEGVINTKNCWKYAQYLLKTLPETFLTLSYIQNENERNDYQKEFFKDCPWEIPPMYSVLSKRPIFYASIFDLLKQKHVIYIDIRTKEEYETVCIKSSLYAHFINGKVNEVVLQYLEKKSNKLTSFENIEDNQSNEFMSLLVIVFNYEKQQDMLDSVSQFLRVGVRRLVVLNGGIQCVQKDRPDLLEYKHRIHPINYYKRKQQ
ncbi:hypothetical protein ABPG74_011079 [Tetrahymena malaccensis]